MKILIVDDQVLMHRCMSRILTDHSVVAVSSVEAARAALNEDQFDLILSDVMMPNETGADFHMWLCQMRPELLPRFVFLTGGSSVPDVASYVRMCGAQVVDKPFNVRDLRDTVSQFATRPPTPARR